ncbi:ketoacyl-ACP synthase III [Roseiconus nitratireducens]|uniref:Beta-ketoacyl-[acyl-carrier-protein] synthase III n=1 Tax=Roseiconus nitratireducens TaxID=2605748 RepID=A0A5M6D1T4_9BACT|nr:beta-ketoacyl-ACP synthase III [Roseiconus nitratireducens]KAA5539609.1 ketoacyl-ACP synthase III [Roseiconus nitratireducens]
MGRVPGIKILGSGAFVPDNVVTNDDLAALGCDSEWIVRRTGILQRRHATDDQATSDLCYEAAVRCLADAGVSADEVDLILVGTITPDHFTPSTACHLQRRLGAFAAAMDVGAACAGFMYALTTGAQFIATGNAKRVLVIGADLMSRTVNPDDKKTYPLFGDGAGAVLIGPDESAAERSGDDLADTDGQAAGILSYQLGSEGCGGEMLCIPAGGTRLPLTEETRRDGLQYLRMDGRNVFKWAVRVFDESAKDVLQAAGIGPDDLSMVILHQANQRIIDSAVSDLGVPPEKVFVNLDRYGNTSGASIPLALDEAFKQGKIAAGDYVLLCGFGSGLAWGTALLRI